MCNNSVKKSEAAIPFWVILLLVGAICFTVGYLRAVYFS